MKSGIDWGAAIASKNSDNLICPPSFLSLKRRFTRFPSDCAQVLINLARNVADPSCIIHDGDAAVNIYPLFLIELIQLNSNCGDNLRLAVLYRHLRCASTLFWT